MKHILKTIIIVVLIYATFILIESMRLENNHTEVITLKKYTYNGIPMRGSFVLFDTFTIWEWVQ